MELFSVVPTYRTNPEHPDHQLLQRCVGLSGSVTYHPDRPGKQSREANLFDKLVAGTEALTYIEVSDVRYYLGHIRNQYSRGLEAFRDGAAKTKDPIDIETAGHVIVMYSGYIECLDAAINLLTSFLDDTILATVVGR
jgi:hypothetical protein